MSVKAAGDNLTSARQIFLPGFDVIRRVTECGSDEAVRAGKVGIRTHIDDNRRAFGAEPCIQVMWRNRELTSVHAQTSSTSRVLRSPWTVVSRGDCIFP